MLLIKVINQLTPALFVVYILQACSPSSSKAETPVIPDSESYDKPFTVDISVESDNSAYQEDVFTYYQTLQPQYIPDYRLRQGKMDFYTKSLSGERITPILDIPNGYIEIMDDQLGEGYVRVQFVLFKKADASDVIAISIQKHDGIGMSQVTHILDMKNNKTLDITKEALSGISVWAFLPEDYAEEESIVEEALTVLIDLPRNGTTAKAIASTEKKFFYCGNHTREDYSTHCGVYGRIQRSEVDLKWNKQKVAFEWQ